MSDTKKLTKLMSPQIMFDLLVGALEGGSNYWYYLPDLNMIPAKDYKPTYPEIDYPECLVSRIWEAIRNGESIPIYDYENEDEKLGELNIESINRGVELMVREHSNHYADAVGENHDATTADVWLQLCTMGELVFG